MLNILLIFIGGGIGAVLRFLLTLQAIKHFSSPHYGTLIINIVGSLFLGYVLALTLSKPEIVTPNVKMFLAVGIAGGFTTFSTFSFEVLMLFKQGQFIQAMLYVLLSPLLALIATYWGYSAGK